MATGILLEFNGLSQNEYDRVMEELHLDKNPPRGGILHLAGTTPNGMRVVDIWESKNAFDVFLRDRLTPLFKQVGITTPRVDYFDIHNVYAPQVSALNALARVVPTR